MKPRLEMGPADRVLLLAPHPDDEALAAAGLLQHAAAADAAIRVVYATDGENNPWAQRAVEHRWRIAAADRLRWGTRRRCETLAALSVLGIPRDAVTFLGLPDQGLTHELLHGERASVAALAREIESFAPTILLAPSPYDLHPDHSALAVLVRFALDHTAACFRWPRRLDYVVHDDRCAPCGLAGGVCVPLDYQKLVRKRAAIRAHRSQLALRERALLAFATLEETFFPTDHPQLDERHPVRAPLVDGHTLVLPLRQTTRFGAFGATTLYLAIDRPQGIRRWRARLPANPGRFELAEVGLGTRVVPAMVEDDPEGRELYLPLAIFRDAAAIFAKLERRFGFFDEAGWHAIELAAERRRDYAAERVRAAAAMSSRSVSVSSQPMQASVIETP